jgi:hypothetical protein
MNILRSYLNCCTIVNLKTSNHSNVYFKGLSEGGGQAVFSKKNLPPLSLCNEDLSNEPNFGWIHLAGQYL